jgi:hypothetical protein
VRLHGRRRRAHATGKPSRCSNKLCPYLSSVECCRIAAELAVVNALDLVREKNIDFDFVFDLPFTKGAPAVPDAVKL